MVKKNETKATKPKKPAGDAKSTKAKSPAGDAKSDTKSTKARERPTIHELLKRDIEFGIRFLNNEEQKLLEVEATLRKMVLMIGDKDRPTTLPSQAVIRVFMSRSVAKSVKKALAAVGGALGAYSASKRELVDDLQNAENDLFPNEEFEVSEITGEIVYKGQGSEEE